MIFPARIWAIAGDSAIQWLSAATFAGAIAASIGNVAFGWASDLVGTRRIWAAAGLCLTIVSYVLMYFASSLFEIVSAIVFYQLALNMLLSPLTAWAADVVPDEEKGFLGGWLAAGPPIGAIAGVLATQFAGERVQFSILCLLIVSLTMPLLLLRRVPAVEPSAPVRQDRARQLKVDFALLWIARLIVQVAGAVLFAFLLFFFRSLPSPIAQSDVAVLSATTLSIAFPLTIGLGRLSDRIGPRKPFLVATVLLAAAGLMIMAMQTETRTAMLGYAIFECSVGIFLALHNAYAMQVLPSPVRRGRDMGILNLTNTFPALIAPVLTILVIPGHGFGMLFVVLAVLMALAALCLLMVRGDARFDMRSGQPITAA
nr:MFS transporter [Sphingomonas telluris]